MIRCKLTKSVLAVMLAAVMGLGAAAPAAASGSEWEEGAAVSETLTALNEASPLPEDPAVAASCTNPAKADEVRAIWIAFLDLEPLLVGRTESQFTVSVRQMFKTCKDGGMNTVIVQVRPYCDSFYPSEYFPWSDYASGEMGQALAYDPLEIMVSEAHALDLSIEAWVNPMRAMTESQITSVSTDYPIRQWYDSYEKYAENLFAVGGRLYLNPASQEVRDLIAAGVVEIVRGYDVDGIHIDDYFYPSMLDYAYDASQYAAYTAQGGTLDQGDWRRENTSEMVRQMYSAVKSADPSVVFGISPRGINEQTYTQLYADVEEWVQNPGYLDYVAPQVYFGFDNSTAPYSTLLEQWSQMVTQPGVKLLIGLSPYKAGNVDQYAGAGKNEWVENSDIIARQIDEARGIDNCDGVVLFRYAQIFGSPSAAMEKEKKNFIALLK